MSASNSVRLQGDKLFDTFVVRTVLLDSEVLARLQNGISVKGFITGGDDSWLQVTDSKTFDSHMVQLSSIQDVVKTNLRIANLSKESRDKMKSMTHAIRNRCRELSIAQRSNKAVR